MDDATLLREYAINNSEAAFEALVSRYVHFVHSAAMRQMRDPHLAEEVTQMVFIVLAKKAGQISDRTILSGWLFKTTRFVAMAQTRAAARRRQYEQELHMQSEDQFNRPDHPLWEQISPLLDEALTKLGEKDRQAILLRFFQDKSLAEIGSSFGAGEDAARMRINRALAKLHRYFNRHGVSSTTTVLAGIISANSIQTAPGVLVKTITTVAVAKGAATSSPTLTLIKGALKIMASTKAKTAIVISIVTILAVGTTTLMIQRQHRLHTPDQNDLPRNLWGFAGYATPEATAQTLFWALREGNTNTFQAYLEGFTPELRMKLENEAKSRGTNAFAELAAHEMGGVTRYRILKRVTLSDTEARLQIQFGGSKGPVQTLTLEKIGNEWKCAGQ